MNSEDSEHKVTIGSENIFADLGLPNADELMVNAVLRHEILDVVQERKLTEARFAEICNVSSSKAAKFLNGRERSFATTELMNFLTLLGRNVEIVVTAQPKRRVTTKGKLSARAA